MTMGKPLTISNPTQLLQEMRRWVQHRERLMDYYGAFKSMPRVQAASLVLMMTDLYRDDTNKRKCELALRMLEPMQIMAAGKRSKYYHSDQERIASFEQYARTYLAEVAPAAKSPAPVFGFTGVRGISFSPEMETPL
jgi:hypothetical protein